MAQQLTYIFADTVRNSGGHAHTFSVTITREAIETAGRVVLCYNLKYDPEHENNVPLNSPGVMRHSYTEEVKRRILSDADHNYRYELAFREASSYQTNPRNLEAFWKPVYRAILLEVIDGIDMCDVLEEVPIWVFDDARDQMPLNATVSMPRGGGKTVYPDLSVVMRKVTSVLNHRFNLERFLPVLVELKRAISRSLTVDGYPDPTKPESTVQLAKSFSVGQRQIELAAYLHLHKSPNQPAIALLAGVGPVIRTLTVTREDLISGLGNALGDPDLVQYARWINVDLEGLDENGRGLDDPPTLNQPRMDPAPIFANNLFDNVSFLPGWSAPAMLKSDAGNKLLGDMQDFVRRML